VRIPATICASLGLAAVFLTASALAHAAAEPAGGKLGALAASAVHRRAWPDLRRYAETARSAERCGLAYFALGYREYEAGEYALAAEDFARAARTAFSLADFADYYRAAAARAANQTGQALAALEDFAARYPDSALRLMALELRARLLLETGQPGQAIQVLTTEPRVRLRPGLALLLAQAYRDAGRLDEAARAFQEIFYAFPTATEAAAAGDAFRRLQAELGENFPQVPVEIQAARAEILYNGAKFQDALNEYDALLRAYPESPRAARWKIGRARCLLRLRRPGEVLPALETRFAEDPGADAERLATLVEAHGRRDDAPAMLRGLDELRERHAQSYSYASALFAAGNFFVRKGDWNAASRHYQPLAEASPQSALGAQASWRVAWAHYLQRDSAKAAEALVNHLTLYPDSDHVPAAVYWLGRLAEERGAAAEARALFELLRRRFVHSYYALQARARLRRLPAPKPSRRSERDSPIVALAGKIPPLAAPPLELCRSAAPSDLLRPALTLQALSLESLGEQYLEILLAERPAAPELVFALSRLEAAQGRVAPALFRARRIVPDYSDYEFSGLPQEIWSLLYPRVYWALVKQQARARGLDPHLVMGLIRQESAFDPRATSRADARGLMQVLPQTARRSRRGRDVSRRLYEPVFNVRLGCEYLRRRLKLFPGNLEQALAAYNAGDSRVKKWIEGRSFIEPAEFLESIPLAETRAYVEAVVRDAGVYRRLMSGSARFAECSPATPPAKRAFPAARKTTKLGAASAAAPQAR